MADKPSLELVGRLLSLLAHDLRNPLSALHSNVGFLGAMVDKSNPDAEEAVADALLSCEGLGNIIDSVEVLSHVLTDTDDFAATPFMLVAFVNEAAASTASLARSHEVSVEIDAASSRLLEAERVFAHRDMAARALAALVRNSIQHAPPGTVVRLSVALEPDACRVIVLDDGTPLAEDVMDAAFSALGQISTKALRGGRYSRGLGLYCARVCATAASAVAQVYPQRTDKNAFELLLKRHKA